MTQYLMVIFTYIQIEDKQGHDEVALTRNFGNEK